jgi:hypothetical protein
VVVIPVAFGDLAFFVPRLARSTLLLRGCIVPVEDRFLRERRLGRNEVGTPQLQQQEDGGINRK